MIHVTPSSVSCPCHANHSEPVQLSHLSSLVLHRAVYGTMFRFALPLVTLCRCPHSVQPSQPSLAWYWSQCCGVPPPPPHPHSHGSAARLLGGVVDVCACLSSAFWAFGHRFFIPSVICATSVLPKMLSSLRTHLFGVYVCVCACAFDLEEKGAHHPVTDFLTCVKICECV